MPVNQSIKQNKRLALTLVTDHGNRHVVSAPPVLIASTHTVDYTCSKCDTVLMHAEEGQVRNLLIHCTECGSYNSTD
jgi:DNA-directed RNA polymerase subunit RPC12/RpoP